MHCPGCRISGERTHAFAEDGRLCKQGYCSFFSLFSSAWWVLVFTASETGNCLFLPLFLKICCVYVNIMESLCFCQLCCFNHEIRTTWDWLCVYLLETVRVNANGMRYAEIVWTWSEWNGCTLSKCCGLFIVLIVRFLHSLSSRKRDSATVVTPKQLISVNMSF